MTEARFEQGEVRSADGTSLSYLRAGRGPAVVLVHGGMQAAHHWKPLAAALADTFTVYLPDRRGRGRSGPPGPRYAMAREREDLQALLAHSGATRAFGLSSGALIVLSAATALPALQRVALYEPPLSDHGSISSAWLPAFDRANAAGRPADALIIAITGLGLSRAFTLIPRWLVRSMLTRYFEQEARTLNPGEPSLRELIPTQRFDTQLMAELDSTLDQYATVRQDVLLLGGGKSPRFLRAALDQLEQTLPRRRRVEFPAIGHDAHTPKAAPLLEPELKKFFI